MRILSIIALFAVGMSVSGCWDDGKAKQAGQFMSGLTKCDDCKLDRPLMGAPQRKEGTK